MAVGHLILPNRSAVLPHEYTGNIELTPGIDGDRARDVPMCAIKFEMRRGVAHGHSDMIPTPDAGRHR